VGEGGQSLQAELWSALARLPQQPPTYAPAAVILGDVDAQICGFLAEVLEAELSTMAGRFLSTASRIRTPTILPEAGQGLL